MEQVQLSLVCRVRWPSSIARILIVNAHKVTYFGSLAELHLIGTDLRGLVAP